MDPCLVRCTIVRGGSSKGVFFERSELPPPGPERDRIILAIFGSPDRRQIDGLGGADKLTSKTAIMGPPTRPDCDIDYLFGQVSIALPRIDWTSNCGNISAGAAAYAVYRGYVAATGPCVSVAIHQSNTGRRLLAMVPVADGQLATRGEYKIGGVPGTGARIDLDFRDFAGCILNRTLLPTASPVDKILIPKLGKIDVSILDMANLCIFVRAIDLGMDNDMGLDALQANQEILATLESIRSAVALKIGLVRDGDVDEQMKIKMNPLLFIVDAPKSYRSFSGEPVREQDTDIFSRSMARWAFSKAYPGSGSIGTGVACVIPGTIPSEIVRSGPPPPGVSREIRIGHPGGVLEVEAGASREHGYTITRATLGRTARILMEGKAFVQS